MQYSSFPLSLPAHKSLARAVCIISQHYSWAADVPVKVSDLTIQVGYEWLQPLGWGWSSSGFLCCSSLVFSHKLHREVDQVQLHLGKLQLITHHSLTHLEGSSFISATILTQTSNSWSRSLVPRGLLKSDGLFNLHCRISAHVMSSYPLNAVL